LVFVLTVRLGKVRRQLAKGRRCRQRAVDERSTAAVDRDFSPDDHLVAAALEYGFDDCV
jgi:hypothetical protein